MADEQVQEDILRYFYHPWTREGPDTKTNLNIFAQEQGLSDQLVWSEFELLREKGLMRAVTAGGWAELDNAGSTLRGGTRDCT